MATSTGVCPKCNQINSYAATRCIDCGTPLPWAAVAAQAQASTPPPQNDTVIVEKKPFLSFDTSGIPRLGIAFMLCGISAALYFAFFFDTTVTVDGGFIGRFTVNNIGLMQTRQTGINMGLGAAILGALMFYGGRLKT